MSEEIDNASNMIITGLQGFILSLNLEELWMGLHSLIDLSLLHVRVFFHQVLFDGLCFVLNLSYPLRIFLKLFFTVIQVLSHRIKVQKLFRVFVSIKELYMNLNNLSDELHGCLPNICRRISEPFYDFLK